MKFKCSDCGYVFTSNDEVPECPICESCDTTEISSAEELE